MTERPILFSGPMVRALLDGRKTQTRRVVKPQPFKIDGEWWIDARKNEACRLDDYVAHRIGCPPYHVGDRLWVKETWADVNLEGGPGIAYRANGAVRDLMEDETFLDERGAFDYDDRRLRFGQNGLRFCVWSSDLVSGVEGSWRSSIHMPRWAARLTLAITDVRVERLQDISEADAKAEGVEQERIGTARNPSWLTFKSSFAQLWDHINGNGTWGENPWVWAVTFEVERAS
jgi:hypothetical protein